MCANTPCNDPQDAFNEFAYSKGAVFSLSQTKRAKRSQVPLIPKAWVSERFLTDYYGQYVEYPGCLTR